MTHSGHCSSGEGERHLPFTIRTAMPNGVRHDSQAFRVCWRSYPSRDATQRLLLGLPCNKWRDADIIH